MAKMCIGIDFGGTFTKFIVLDGQFKPGRTVELPTPKEGGAKAVAAVMVEGARQVVQRNNLRLSDVLGVGIGSPGPLKIAEGVVVATPNIPGMENAPLTRMVGGELGIPTVLENDANAAGYGEYLCGDGAGDLVFLTLGTGVGAGIILGGEVLHGCHEMGAEVGHMIIVPGGELCGCGQRGCLERYCSATYIAQRMTRRLGEPGAKSSLKGVLAAKGEITSKDITEAVAGGDALAAEMWDEAMMLLAIGCVNICRTLDPDEIVLGGGMAKAGQALMKPLEKHFNDQHWNLTKPTTRLVLARLGNDAGAIGAAGVAWKRLAKIGRTTT